MPSIEPRAVAAAGTGGRAKLLGWGVRWVTDPQVSGGSLVLDSLLNPGDFLWGQVGKGWREMQTARGWCAKSRGT